MMTEGGVMNLAQVYTTLKYTRESNEAISTEMLAAVKLLADEGPESLLRDLN